IRRAASRYGSSAPLPSARTASRNRAPARRAAGRAGGFVQLVDRVAQAGELLAQLAHRRHHPDHRLAHPLVVALAFEVLVESAQGLSCRGRDRAGLGDLEREYRLAARLESGGVALVEFGPVVETELEFLVGVARHTCLHIIAMLARTSRSEEHTSELQSRENLV